MAETTYTIETDLFKAVLSNAGGDIVSLQLKKHKDKAGYVDLIVPGEKGSSGIALSFGAQDVAPVKELMTATWLDAEKKNDPVRQNLLRQGQWYRRPHPLHL